MEESARRFLSRLWLLQAAVFSLLGYIPRLSGMNCYCYNEPNDGFPICFWEGDSCSGDVCYIHKELLNGVIYTNWNCLRESEHHIDKVCGGAFNTATEGYKCCQNGDNCNEGLQLELGPSTSAPVIATTIEAGSGSGSRTLRPVVTTELTDEPETTSTHVSSMSTTTRSRTLPSAQPTSTTQPLNTALKCFCSSCPTNEASCGPSSSCYVGKDFGPGQEVSGAADSYSWGCFSESEAAMKCQETDKYRCCSDRDKCNEHLDPPPIKCSCTSNSCPNGQDYVSCGSNSSCYVSLPFDSTTTTSLAPDSLVWGCFNKSEAKVKCSDTNRYSCCSSGDFCNENLDPPTLRSVEPTSTSAECNSVSGGCQAKRQQEKLLPIIAAVTVVIALVVFVIVILGIGVLWVQIRKLKQGKHVNSVSSASDSSENSITTESESLPSPTSTSSPHHYLHVTGEEPAFGNSLKCSVSKA